MPESIMPGDVLVCACGARSNALWHTGTQHVDGWPLMATWPAAKRRRNVVVRAWIGLCPDCTSQPPSCPVVDRAGTMVNVTPPVVEDLLEPTAPDARTTRRARRGFLF